MKDLPALGRVVGSSHARLARVDLHRTTDGALLGTLPVTDGRVTGTAFPGGRWAGQATVPGLAWAPTDPDSPLAGFTPHHCRIYAGAQVDRVDRMVEVARLMVAGCTVRRTASDATVDVDLIGLDRWVYEGAPVDYRPELGRTCQDAIANLYLSRAPTGWRLTVVDSTVPVPVPVAFTAEQVPPGQLIADLESIAGVTTFVDALGRLVIRPPLPTTPTAPVRTLTAAADLVAYQLDAGRSAGGTFANRVRVEWQPIASLTGPRTKRRFSANWDRVATNDPPAGQFRLTATNLRVGYNDRTARRRRRDFRRVEAGDLIQLLFNGGVQAVYEVQSATMNDTRNYLDCDVAELDRDGTLPATETNVEVAFFVAPDAPRVATATKVTGPLGTTTAGRVDYTEQRLGNITDEAAQAYADRLLATTLRGWLTARLDVVPDVRLEPDDDIAVTYPGGTTLPHRLVELELPLGPTDPMRLTCRTFDLKAPALTIPPRLEVPA